MIEYPCCLIELVFFIRNLTHYRVKCGMLIRQGLQSLTFVRIGDGTWNKINFCLKNEGDEHFSFSFIFTVFFWEILEEFLFFHLGSNCLDHDERY